MYQMTYFPFSAGRGEGGSFLVIISLWRVSNFSLTTNLKILLNRGGDTYLENSTSNLQIKPRSICRTIQEELQKSISKDCGFIPVFPHVLYDLRHRDVFREFNTTEKQPQNSMPHGFKISGEDVFSGSKKLLVAVLICTFMPRLTDSF